MSTEQRNMQNSNPYLDKAKGVGTALGTAAGGILLGTPIAIAGQVSAAKMLQERVPAFLSGSRDVANHDTVKRTLERMGGAHIIGPESNALANTRKVDMSHNPALEYADVNFHNENVMPAMLPGKNFHDGKPVVAMGKHTGKDILMHELGHEQVSRSKLNTMALRNAVSSKAGKYAMGTAALYSATDDDRLKYLPLITEAAPLATFIDEQHANMQAAHSVYKTQGIKDAGRFLKHVIPTNGGSYLMEAGPRMIGGYAGIKAVQGIRSALHNRSNEATKMQQTKQASWRDGSIEALRDFGVIGAADLAAMALHEKFNRENTAMPVEHPENVYLQKVAEQLEQEKQANLISTIANGAKAAWGGVKSVAGDFAAKNPGAAKHVTNAWDKTQAFATKHPIATSIGASVVINKATS